MEHTTNKTIKILFACLDWRLHPAIENFFINNNTGCDLCVTAGSAKGLLDSDTKSFFLEQIAISKKLHNCKGVILTMHKDCGAYGGSAAFENSDKEDEYFAQLLAQAQKIVQENYPGILIEKYIIGLTESGGGWIIDPRQII